MDPRIEQVLLAQAAQEAEQGPRLSDMVALGAGGGAAMGALLGTVPHMAGVGINKGLDAVAPIRPMIKGTNGAVAQALEPTPRGRMFKPGYRMAGGLVGAILGGGLGAAAQQSMANQTGSAGAMLAKIQAQGGMLPGDEAQLEAILKDAYSSQGLLG